jgi:prepilin-type N-terminal cleavage/methylation domain-containing protein
VSLTRKGRPGLTLIEILFALSVLAVALLGVAGMFPSALRSVYAGGQTTKATTLAREMADMIRGDVFGDLVSRYDGFSTQGLSVVCPVPLRPPALWIRITARRSGPVTSVPQGGRIRGKACRPGTGKSEWTV